MCAFCPCSASSVCRSAPDAWTPRTNNKVDNKRRGLHRQMVLTLSRHLAGLRPSNSTQQSHGWCVASAITPGIHLAGVCSDNNAQQSHGWCVCTATMPSKQQAGAWCENNTQEPPGCPAVTWLVWLASAITPSSRQLTGAGQAVTPPWEALQCRALPSEQAWP